MPIDVPAARSFMAAHGRILDQRRLELLLDRSDPAAVLAALDGYRNPDGGYAWGLEPDFRVTESQPAAGMHAFEVFAEVGTASGGAVTSPQARALCDWLDGITLADGGLPFALPVADGSGSAPFWTSADPTVSVLQMTTQVAANAHRTADHDPAVAAHPWLGRATCNCIDAIRALDAAPPAYELEFALRFVDAAAARDPEVRALVGDLARFVPADGRVAVEGGNEDETLDPLDLAPYPGTPSRGLFDDAVIAADLERLAARQQPDGGWIVDYSSFSPAAGLEWRGYVTVKALDVLRANSY